MITSWEIYWFTRLDPLRALIGSVTTICLILSLTMFLLYPMFCDVFEDDEAKKKKSISWSVRLHVSAFLVAIVSTMAYSMVPTTKEMAAIKVIPIVAGSESMKKLGDVGSNMLDLANEWLKELKPKKTE